MSFLPVVERELRAASRHPHVFWVRVFSGGGGTLTVFGLLFFSSPFGPGFQTGMPLLNALSWVVFWVCLMAGPMLTSDTISFEKREGTLGLLFLTDLRGLDVVLGKLVAASVTAVLALLAVLPVMAIAILLGGVQFGDVLRATLVLVNTLFVSLAVGIFMSACCIQWRSAIALTGLVLFLLAFVATFYGGMDEFVGGGTSGWSRWIAKRMSPVLTLALVPSTRYQGAETDFWISLLVLNALGWAALAGASSITARAWREQTGLAAKLAARKSWRNWLHGGPSTRQRLHGLLDKDPIAWLKSRHCLKRRLLWGFVGIALVVWIYLRARYPSYLQDVNATWMVGLGLLGVVKWLVASEASHHIATELQAGTLELLLTTPLTVGEIVRGNLRAMDKLFMIPAAAIVVVETVMLAQATPVVDKTPIWMALVSIVTALWDIKTLEWVGMWLAMKKKRPDRAFTGTIRRILIMPWAALIAILVGAAFADQWRPGHSVVWENVPLIWLIICVATNVGFGVTARRDLLERFRLCAAKRYELPA